MEINRGGGEESSENELASSTLAYCHYSCVLCHPSDTVKALNPMITHSFGNPPLSPPPSHSKGVGRAHAAEKAFTFEWEIPVWLTQRSK